MTKHLGILDLLGVLEREISISRLVRAALERSPAALDILTGRSGNREGLQVSTERPFSVPGGRSRRADLFASWWQDGGPHALVVEHKLLADEGVDQSTDYAAARNMFAGWALERFENRHGHPPEVAIVMLTLLDDPPSDDSVRHVKHVELAPIFAEIKGDDAGSLLAREWAGLVRDHAIASQLDESARLEQTFSSHECTGLDPRYSRFQRFAEMIKNASGGQLELHGTYRSGRSGRGWYGAQFAFVGTAPTCSRSAKVPGNPATDWWLHFQVRLDVSGDCSITLGAFCETLPYVPQARFNKEVGEASQRDAYRAVRMSMEEGFRQIAGRPGSRWRARGSWCQVARFTPNWVSKDSVADVALSVAIAIVELRADALRLLHAARNS